MTVDDAADRQGALLFLARPETAGLKFGLW